MEAIDTDGRTRHRGKHKAKRAEREVARDAQQRRAFLTPNADSTHVVSKGCPAADCAPNQSRSEHGERRPCSRLVSACATEMNTVPGQSAPMSAILDDRYKCRHLCKRRKAVEPLPVQERAVPYGSTSSVGNWLAGSQPLASMSQCVAVSRGLRRFQRCRQRRRPLHVSRGASAGARVSDVMSGPGAQGKGRRQNEALSLDGLWAAGFKSACV